MFDLMKRGLFMGIGLANLTKERVEQLGREVAQQAKLSEADAKKFQAELAQKAEEARVAFEAEIDRRIDHAMIQIGLVKASVSKRGQEVSQEVQAWVDQRIEQALARLHVARTEEIAALISRLELLEKKLAQSHK